MTTHGVTSTGFQVKRLADILEDFRVKLAAVEDPVTGETLAPDLADENDPLILQVNAFADALAVCWEQMQIAYNQYDPLKATGAALSGLVQLNALTRKAGTKSTVSVALVGSPGTAISAGKRVSTMDDSAVFELTSDTVLDGSGEAVVVVRALREGPTTAVAGSVVKIVTPVTGWFSVTNPLDATPGTAQETDAALRKRQQETLSAASGGGNIDSIYGALFNLEGVSYCRIYQNVSLSTDSKGLPAKSVSAVVQGGDEDEITDVLFAKIAAGVLTYGNTTVVKTDLQGLTYDINFTRPVAVPIYITVNVTVVSSAVWAADSDAKIKAAVMAWATGSATSLGISSGYDQDGYGIGQSVYASELYVPVNSVLGAKITAIYVGKTSSPSGDSAAIDWDEVAAFDPARIIVNITGA